MALVMFRCQVLWCRSFPGTLLFCYSVSNQRYSASPQSPSNSSPFLHTHFYIFNWRTDHCRCDGEVWLILYTRRRAV